MTPQTRPKSSHVRYGLWVLGFVLGFLTIAWLVYGFPALPALQEELVPALPLDHQLNCPSEVKRVAVVGKYGHMSLGPNMS